MSVRMGKGRARVVRCAVYVRTAIADPDAAARQRAEALAFVEQYAGDGWTLIAQAYEDVGASGLAARRPALGRLLADVRAGRVDRVVATDVARFARSQRLLRGLARRFQAGGATVEFTTAGAGVSRSIFGAGPGRARPKGAPV